MSDELIWQLRALAQGAEKQKALYPVVVVADELVLDFDVAFSQFDAEFRADNPDLEAIDAHIASESESPEHWTVEALESSEFWKTMRTLALAALNNRGLDTSAPPEPEVEVIVVRD